MTEQLSLNESAYVTEKVFSVLVRDAPDSTGDARETGGEAHLRDVCLDQYVDVWQLHACLDRYVDVGQLHAHHRAWAEAGLNDTEVLDLVEKLRARLKVVGDAALVARGLEAVPWYD